MFPVAFNSLCLWRNFGLFFFPTLLQFIEVFEHSLIHSSGHITTFLLGAGLDFVKMILWFFFFDPFWCRFAEMLQSIFRPSSSCCTDLEYSCIQRSSWSTQILQGAQVLWLQISPKSSPSTTMLDTGYEVFLWKCSLWFWAKQLQFRASLLVQMQSHNSVLTVVCKGL